MSDRPFVYCYGTEDGKGVIEALKNFGGRVDEESPRLLKGNAPKFIYYIAPNGIIKSCNPDVDRDLADCIRGTYSKIEPQTRWRAQKYSTFYTVMMDDTGHAKAYLRSDSYNPASNIMYKSMNYYRTRDEAEFIANKINALIRNHYDTGSSE